MAVAAGKQAVRRMAAPVPEGRYRRIVKTHLLSSPCPISPCWQQPGPHVWKMSGRSKVIHGLFRTASRFSYKGCCHNRNVTQDEVLSAVIITSAHGRVTENVCGDKTSRNILIRGALWRWLPVAGPDDAG
jgi:hypothetical protein